MRIGQELGEGVGGGDAQGEDLADDDKQPEVGREEVAPPVGRAVFQDVNTMSGSGVFVGLRWLESMHALVVAAAGAGLENLGSLGGFRDRVRGGLSDGGLSCLVGRHGGGG